MGMLQQIPNFLTGTECSEFLYEYQRRYDATFRLDWEVERTIFHTDRKQRLYLFPENDKIMKPFSDRILEKFEKGSYLKDVFIAEYNVGEGVDWHTDFPYFEKEPPYKNERRINFSILLNNSFEGGILEVNDKTLNTPVGTVTFFDVNFNHRVTRVTKGTRYSLIGWVYM